ncbi:MAG: signal recognition particle-docking protein FtsY [Phycisphaerae bacterium]|jgi:fused signal recognition particle receptor|nr:signal recognition particle-docking protein FtsY [Phycisphaerae bacterium]
MVLKKFFDRFRKGLTKTREKLGSGLRSLFTIGRKIDAAFLDELEETLILGDIGVETAMKIVEDLKQQYRDREIQKGEDLLAIIKRDLVATLGEADREIHMAPSGPTVILVAGVNGSGKTTSIAKLSKMFIDQGRKVLLAACDTFRAAAVEQLAIWSERVGVDMVRHKMGSDPGAVAFDAADAAVGRDIDILIVDTAGRLHTQDNLMRELEKIRRVLEKKIPGAPHEVILVLDATTGQNAIAQAKVFRDVIDVSGIFLAKLDGTAKGGIVLTIKNQLGIPVKFVGLGETADDIAPFDPETFVEAMFGE